MPLYEYECAACGERFELIRRFSDPEVEACARCGKGPVRRLPSSPAIQFKGSGWYVTDYARKAKSDSSSSAGKAKSDGGDKKTDGKGETTAKPDAPAKPSS